MISINSEEDLLAYGRLNFLNGEIEALSWILTYSKIPPEMKSHIEKRLAKLQAGVRGEIKPEHSGLEPRLRSFEYGEHS